MQRIVSISRQKVKIETFDGMDRYLIELDTLVSLAYTLSITPIFSSKKSLNHKSL